MRCAIDASTIIAAMTDNSVAGRWAEDLIDAGGLLAPQLLPVEVANILRRFELRGVLTSVQARTFSEALLRLDVELVPFRPCAERVWELRRNLTCYDAWYVAVAERFDVPLATFDLRLARSTGPRCRFVLPA